MPARILVVGRSGQLAAELARMTPPAGVVVEAVGRNRLDLTRPGDTRTRLRDIRPDAVINAAAFTAVDRAESEAEAAMALNRDGPAALAAACADRDIPLLHLSTDFVFNGAKASAYVETDPKDPVNVYGRSKSEGEDRVLASGDRATVMRTSWLYSSHGVNFLRTMLRLAETRDEIGVVDDQFGSPTWAADLARASLAVALRMLDREPAAAGVLHYAGAGDASRADFAEAIFAGSGRRGGPTARVRRIATAAYPTPARRPPNSRLSSALIQGALGIAPRDWREACDLCIAERPG